MHVTAVEPINKKKCKVYIDGELAFALYNNELYTYNIKINEELLESDYNKIISDVLNKRAKLRAMNLLMVRNYTEAGMRRKLSEGCYPEAIINNTLDYIKSYGYINDVQYACMFIRENYKRMSQKQMINKLIIKGIRKEVWQNAFELCAEENIIIDEEQQIKNYLKKKQYNPDEIDGEQKQKLIAALCRRGFSLENIIQIMRCSFT